MIRKYLIIWKRYSRIWLNKLVLWRIARISERHFLYLLSLVIGILSGIAAIILKNLIHFVSSKLMGWIAVDSIGFLFLLYPLIGIFLTFIFVKYIVKDDIGHGITKILHSISREESRLKKHNTWTSMVASSLTIGLGGSVGAEAPIVLTGASIGSNLARLFRLDYKFVTLMVGCGAAGAISGIFNAPIAGIVFTLEILMLDLTMGYLIPLLISAVTATLFTGFLMGEEVLLRFIPVHDFTADTIWFYILLGVFTGLLGIWFTRMSMNVEAKFKKIKSSVVRILTGGVVLGLLIFVFPPLWGEGYNEIALIFKGKGTDLMNNSVLFSWQSNEYLLLLFLAGILIFKVIAMAATTGAGGVGGVFAPTLFMGGIAGYFFTILMNSLFNLDLPGDNFALAGMSGMMAAVMHAPLTGIFLAAELTSGYGLFVPLMITAVSAYVTIIRTEPYSIYNKLLAQRGELLTHHADKVALRLMDVRDLIETDFELLKPDAMLRDLVNAVSVSHRNLYPVVGPDDSCLGMVKLSDVRSLIFKHEKYDEVRVKDIMYMPEFYISPDDSMEKLVEKFESSGRYNLAVIENGKYLGFISRAVAFSEYRKTVQDFSTD